MTLSKIAFYGALAITLMISSLYLFNIIKWGELPDRGIYFRSATGIKVVGSVSETGRKAGVEVGDRILNVNGKTFTNMKELRAAVRQELGEKNTYLLERGGKPFEVTITNMPLGIQRVFMMSGLPYLTGLCYVLMGTLVFFMKPHRRTSWIFFIFSAAMGLLLTFIFRPGPLKPHWLGTVHIFLYALAPAVIIHLVLTFPEERVLIKKYPYVAFIPYLASMLLFLAMRYAVTEMVDIPRKWFIVLIFFLAFALFLFILSCFQLWFRSASEIVKLRAKVVLLGAAISASVYISDALINALFHVYLVRNFNYHVPFLLAFPFFVGYSIVKHNLFDIDGTIRRTFGYIFITIGIAIIYTFSVFVPPLFLVGFKSTESVAFPLVFTLLMLFLFNLARGRIQRFVDRVFYRLDYNYEETVEKISEKMRSLLTLEDIGQSMIDFASNIFFVDKGHVLLLNSKDPVYEALPSRDPPLKLSADDPLVQKVVEKKREVTLYDIEEDPIFEKERETCKRSFERLEAALIIPLIYENNLVGLMSLGNKKSGKFYRQLDIKLLRTLANQGALAIENVKLHQARLEALEHSRIELERLNRAKSIALDHLSHELRTPLAIIKGTIQLMKRKLPAKTPSISEERSFGVLEKQLNRLMEIQQETDSIIRSQQELERELVPLFSVAKRVLAQIEQRTAHREIHFYLEGEKDLCVLIPPKTLEEVVEGLLRNAIENTPDEGMVRIILEQKDRWIQLKVMDFGVGITVENQRHLFDGLFHTLDTELYSSKQPYEFGAGGKGLNLLRIKTFGQRFGFDITAGSQRCSYLPTNRDLCPGRISKCPHCKGPRDCQSSGGSTFCVIFPLPSENRKQRG